LFLLIAAGFVSSGSLVYDEGAPSDWLRIPTSVIRSTELLI